MTRFNRLLQLLQAYDMSKFSGKEKEACQILINALKDDNVFADLAKPWSQEDRALIRAIWIKHAIANDWDDMMYKNLLEEVFEVAPNAIKYFVD